MFKLDELLSELVRLETLNAELLEACKMASFLYEEGYDMFENMQEATAYASKTKKALDKAIAKTEGKT